jgi:dihydroneopterin aldolase
MDRIQVKGIVCQARIGVPKREQVYEQKLIVDVSLEADLSKAIAGDDFQQTIDYSPLVEKVRATVESRRFYLIEALAGEICDAIMRDSRVESLSVTVKKFPANLRGQVEHVAATLERTR